MPAHTHNTQTHTTHYSSQAAQERAAAEFRRAFEPYDWTRALH